MHIPVRNAVISLAAHLGLLFVLVQVFKLHIYGVVIADAFFAICMCILNGFALRKYLRYRQELVRTFVIPIVSSVIMGLSCWLLYPYLEKPLGFRWAAVLCIVLAVLIYGLFILILRALRRRNCGHFPRAACWSGF